MNHPNDDELAEYAAEPKGKRKIAVHVAKCEPCRNRVAEYQMFEEALHSPDTWKASVKRIERYQRRNAAFAEADRLDAERSAAEAALQPLLESIVRFTNAKVVEQPVFQTIGGTSVLTNAARAARDRQPQFAVRISEAAVTLARRLAKAEGAEVGAVGAYARALLEHGIALFLTGSYRDAERALKASEEIFEEDRRSTGWDLACVWLALANVYVETERPKEAEVLAEGAARRFVEYGDTLRHLLARLVELSVRWGQCRYEDGAAIADRIVALGREHGYPHLVAQALLNGGRCYAELARYARAGEYYAEAAVLWDELRVDLERVRTDWAVAELTLATGSSDQALAQLKQVQERFEFLGATNDAALARLDMGEALLALGRPQEAAELLNGLALTFASEGMARKSREALGYLTAALNAGTATMEDVRSVRTYLHALPYHPAAAFAPLQ